MLRLISSFDFHLVLFLQEKRLVAQVNAVAVLDMIKDLQDEIKVRPSYATYCSCTNFC